MPEVFMIQQILDPPPSASDCYTGWESYYQQVGEQAAWDDKPAPEVARFIDRLAGRDPSHLQVADLGCGDGRNLWPWLNLGARVTAVDIAPTALYRISDACRARGVVPPTLLHASLERLPLADAQFDAAQCLDALPQVVDAGAAMAEMARILRPGGEILFNVYTRNDCCFGEGEAVGEDAFEYKGTFFRFFDEPAVRALLPPTLAVMQMQTLAWDDPPHVPFRPYPHRHESIVLVCRRTE
jgi:SAM-dependent methyltransferase